MGFKFCQKIRFTPNFNLVKHLLSGTIDQSQLPAARALIFNDLSRRYE